MLALLLLIVIHEYGHFIVARWCGVKVLRFSFGFGKVLASWHDKHGTEYAWSLFPLGGYVKMLDEAEGEVPESQRHLAFNNKSIWARIAIIAAGPLFNFIFAFIALWLVLIIGIKSLAPMIDNVIPGGIAAKAGLKAHQEILFLDDKKIASWRDFQYALIPFLGTKEVISLNVKSLIDHHEETVTVPLENWQMDTKNPDMLASLGIMPFIPTIPPIVGEVMEASPAQKVGLKKGDVIISVNGQAISDWLMLVSYVKQRPQQTIKLKLKREKSSKIFTIKLTSIINNGQEEGSLGIKSQPVELPPHWLRLQREAPLPAIKTAFEQTTGLIGSSFKLIGRLVTGKLPIESISGPVGIAQGAGESARSGLVYYLSFLALVSISLGVLNLLPIPLLDGGQLFYCLIEMIKGKSLSEESKSIGIYLGLVLLVALMIIALSNDLSRVT